MMYVAVIVSEYNYDVCVVLRCDAKSWMNIEELHVDTNSKYRDITYSSGSVSCSTCIIITIKLSNKKIPNQL